VIVRECDSGLLPEIQHKLTVFESDESGRLRSRVQPTEYGELIEQAYAQKREMSARLLARLAAGALSPIGYYLELQRLTVAELAARARVSGFKVRAHLTPAGFLKARVETLGRYARVFDVDVADFFQLLELAPGVGAERGAHGDRMLQRLRVGRSE
jgi:hypothetical protein